jgi:ATP:ADP antiporter, AAA family
MKGLPRQLVDIHKDEVEPAALFFSLWFLLILIFQVLKPLKKGLFVDSLGAYVELYAKLGNIGVALLVMIVFTALYNRLGSRRLIAVLCSFFVLALLGFAAVFQGGPPSTITNWVFYFFGDAWSTVWVTTFWAYLNELTRTEQSKRLYGFIGGGGVVGGLLGGIVVWQFVKPVGVPLLLTGCAALTLIVGLLIRRVERVAGTRGAAIGRRERDPATASHAGVARSSAAIEGAKLVASSRYLSAVTAIIFLYELVSQILDYQYSTAAEALEGAGATQAFFGEITSIISFVGILTQFFLVSFVIRRFGLTTALLVLPVAMAISSGFYFVTPVLAAAALLTISDNAFAYTINQTARETLFMPTSADVKYKGRAFANMFVQRFGKGVAILMALALTMVPIRFPSLVAILVIAIWIVLAVYAGRQFEALTKTKRAG